MHLGVHWESTIAFFAAYSLAEMKDLFLNIGDLPLHPLAVHFAVALFPVSLLLLIAVIIIKRLRERFLTGAVAAVILTLPFIFVAQQSGESLSEVLYEPQPHSEYGEMLMPLALATAAVAAVMWLVQKKSWNKTLLQLLAVATISMSVASIAMTFVVGHSGAQAVWGGRVSQQQVDASPMDPGMPNSATGIKASEVAVHNTPGDCWVVINGSVYQLDSFISQHPGGQAVLTSLCGKDGTKAFMNQHAQQALPNSELAKLLVGPLAADVSDSGQSANADSNAAVFSADQISSHTSISDCWTVIEKTVYDLSGYAQEHPGGANNISALCGKDATSAFAGQHGFKGVPANVLSSMAIGTFIGTAKLPSTNIVYGENED